MTGMTDEAVAEEPDWFCPKCCKAIASGRANLEPDWLKDDYFPVPAGKAVGPTDLRDTYMATARAIGLNAKNRGRAVVDDTNTDWTGTLVHEVRAQLLTLRCITILYRSVSKISGKWSVHGFN